MRPFNVAETKIAERRYYKERIGRHLSIVIVLVAFTLAVAAGSFVGKMALCSNTEQVKGKLSDVQERTIQIKQEMAEANARLSQREWQDQLASGSRKWRQIISDVTASLPTNVWLKKIENSAKESTILIEGDAASFAALSAFMDRLRTKPTFVDVRLTSSRSVAADVEDYLDFSLTLYMKPLPSAAETTDSAEKPALVPETEGPEQQR